MATLTTTISYGEPTGSLVATIGTPGPQGVPGPQGPQGPQGIPGSAATIAVGTVTTVPTDNPATVTNVGSTSAAVFNFGLPQGDQGDPGPAGVVAATAPILYDSGTQTVSINLNPTEFGSFTLTDSPNVAYLDAGLFRMSGTAGHTDYLSTGITFPDATTQSTAATPFNGGAVANPITISDGTNDSEMSAAFFGVELSSDTTQYAELQYNSLTIGNAGSNMQITPAGLTFPDATVQTTAYTGGGGVTWGSITGTLSNQTDLQNALNAKYDASNPLNFVDAGYVSSALTGYATESFVTTQGYITTPFDSYNRLNFGSGTNPDSSPVAGHFWFQSDKFYYSTSVSSLGNVIASESWVTSQGYTTAAFVPGSGDLDMMGYSITNANFSSSAGQVSAQNVSLSSGGSITFGDSTVQTTAYTGGGGGGLPVVQIAASAINPNYISTGANFTPITYPTHTDILNGTYATSFIYQTDPTGNPALILSGLTSLYNVNVNNNAVMTSAPSFSGCTSLNYAQVNSNALMTSAPSFSGLTALNTAQVYSNASMTSAPSFSGCTALVTANVYDNASMTSAPDFSGLTALYTANVTSNTAMTSAPSFSGCTSLYQANVYYNSVMTSAPDFSGCTSLYQANVYYNAAMTSAPDFTTITQSGIQINLSGCAISDCTTPLDQLDAGGGSSGFIDLSGGTNQSIDPAYVSLTNLQSKGWTVVFNSL